LVTLTVVAASLTVTSSQDAGKLAVVVSGKAPSATYTFTGAGFKPGEVVYLEVSRSSPRPPLTSYTAVTDRNGALVKVSPQGDVHLVWPASWPVGFNPLEQSGAKVTIKLSGMNSNTVSLTIP
jgi:hypothetical protein